MHLEECFRSVFSQVYPSIEYIVVDGGSTDGSRDIIQQYSDKIARWISEPDKGIYDAINKGINLATGDVTGLLHSDDLFESTDTIAHIAEAFQNNSCDAVYGNLVYTSRHNPDQVLRFWKSKPFSKNLLRNGWMPPHPTLFVKSHWFNVKGAYRTDFRIAADYDLILRLFGTKEFSCVYLDEVITRMRTGGASNASIKNIFLKSKEDWIALRQNKAGGLLTLFLKNIRKIFQFVFKPKREDEG